MNIEIDISLMYMIIVLIIFVIFKFYRPFRRNLKLQRFSPLFLILIVIPTFVRIPFNPDKPMLYIVAILLIIFAIWGTYRNFRKSKANPNPA